MRFFFRCAAVPQMLLLVVPRVVFFTHKNTLSRSKRSLDVFLAGFE